MLPGQLDLLSPLLVHCGPAQASQSLLLALHKGAACRLIVLCKLCFADKANGLQSSPMRAISHSLEQQRGAARDALKQPVWPCEHQDNGPGEKAYLEA